MSVDRPSPILLALSGTFALAIAMGIGRFAFTPLLPMMLHDGKVTLLQGGWLATSNYVGYMVGALVCMAVPARFAGPAAIKAGMVATALLSFAMALPEPSLWPALRFLSGATSAVVLVFTSGWCLAMLASRGKVTLGGVMFAGPGCGIIVSGLLIAGLVAFHASSATGWIAMGTLALALAIPSWPIMRGRPPIVARNETAVSLPIGHAGRRRGQRLEMALLTLAYGMGGFGYIVTATFLPVIARTALPGGSIWLDLFWPVLGLGAAVGALACVVIPGRFDNRTMLLCWYACQGMGVPLALIFPSIPGFVLSSFMVGLGLTSTSFFGLQEVRRLRPHDAARYMGLLTASFGLGQMSGPPVSTLFLAHAASEATGFAWGLGIAASGMFLGAALCGLLRLTWPRDVISSV